MDVFVVIFEQLLPISGGGTPRFRKLIDVFIERGHDVSVAAAFNIDIKEALNILKCNRILRLRDVRFAENKISKYLFFSPLNISNVIKEAMRIKPDIIISNNYLAGLAGLLAKKITGCLSIINIGDLLFEYIPFYIENNLLTQYLFNIGRKLENKILRDSDKIIAISNYMKQILIQRGAKKENIDIIYDGVDIDLFKTNMNEAKKIREKYAKGAENVVLFHGVISPQDRLEIIANAAVDVLKKYPSTSFWIVGAGSAIPKIREIIKTKGIDNHFFFSGWIPHEVVPSFISACDVGLVILPNDISAKTKVTLKTFEYWACEKPIVISDLYAPREVVLPWKTGLFYRPEDPEDLAEKVCILLEDKNLCRKMGRAGREIVEKKFNWSLLTTKIVKTCEDLYFTRSKRISTRTI